jgi:osmotically-inducible protein OsmY
MDPRSQRRDHRRRRRRRSRVPLRGGGHLCRTDRGQTSSAAGARRDRRHQRRDVHPNSAFYVSETDIGKEVEQALRSATNVPDTVKAVIDGHAVTLLGEVAWDFQRRAAKRAVRYLRGVYSVDSRITLTPRVSAVDTAERIKAAILRNAQVDARTVEVSADGTKVTLSGTVRSWAERRQADLAAWSSPHVTEVYNHIVVEP